MQLVCGGFYNFNPSENSVETGRFICMGTPLQSIESFCLGFDFAFDYLKVDKVIMSALETNTNMKNMQKRFGATPYLVIYNEEFGCDSVYSEILKKDYPLLRRNAMKIVQRFANRPNK